MDRLWTDDDVPDQADYWVGRVQSIRRFTSRDKDTRAPYKPLLLLWLIGRMAEGLPARVSFTKAELQGPSTEQQASHVATVLLSISWPSQPISLWP